MRIEEDIQKKNNKSLIIIILVVIVVIGTVSVYLLRSKSAPIQTQPAVRALPKEVQVVLTDDGFNPNIVTIKAGSAVRWVNNTDNAATVNSDDHPTHRKYRELNLGEFNNNSTLVHIFVTKGTYTYHDHLHPERKGTVIVE